MATPGWLHAASPFHGGERSIQAQYGILERMDRQGRRIIRDHIAGSRLAIGIYRLT